MSNLLNYIHECLPVLQYEQRLLQRMLYKNKYQYKKHQFYRYNTQLYKCNKHIITQLQTCTKQPKNIQSLEQLLYYILHTMPIVYHSIDLLLSQLNQTYFMSISTLLLAINVRIQTLIKQAMLHTLLYYQHLQSDTTHLDILQPYSITEWIYAINNNSEISLLDKTQPATRQQLSIHNDDNSIDDDNIADAANNVNTPTSTPTPDKPARSSLLIQHNNNITNKQFNKQQLSTPQTTNKTKHQLVTRDMNTKNTIITSNTPTSSLKQHRQLHNNNNTTPQSQLQHKRKQQILNSSIKTPITKKQAINEPKSQSNTTNTRTPPTSAKPIITNKSTKLTTSQIADKPMKRVNNTNNDDLDSIFADVSD